MSGYVITSGDAVFSDNAIYYFKKNIKLKAPAAGTLKITAEARYKLRINGKTVSFGPYKGSGREKYYDSIDIGGFLKAGENEIFIEVLQLASAQELSRHRFLSSVQRTGMLALLADGDIVDDGKTVRIHTNSSWLCARENGISFIEPTYAYYGGLNESVGADYKKALEWREAKEIIKEEEIFFYGETKLWDITNSDLPKQTYDKVSISQRDAAGSYDMGHLMTGFVRIKARGRGRLKLTYAEAYVFEENGAEHKRDRADVSGVLAGDYDIIDIDGETEYETFWFRTFRYIKAEADEAVALEDICAMETRYPAELCGKYDFGSERDNKLWEISVRTLQCCMHETYEDCPYYEQLQYAMDTYLQMIFSMKIFRDIGLAKRAAADFARSITAGGICQSRFPSITPQYIPGFSLFFIMMLDAIGKNRGDYEFIKQYLGTVDSIFCGFGKLEREDGLVSKSKYWDFIDWAKGWENGPGAPGVKNGEANTVYSLMYAYSLDAAAGLNLKYGRRDVAVEYSEKAAKIRETVKLKCYDAEAGLYADTDEKRSFSQHAQVWAVLCGLENTENSKKIMKKSMTLETKCGFAYAYFLFRAFEAADEYELCGGLMKQYYDLIELNCTTVPETFENPRSECHGWGAAAIYEFTSMVLGVKENGSHILIKPYTKGRDAAEGYVFTVHGGVHVWWRRHNGRLEVNAEAENESEIEIVMPDNKSVFGIGKCSGICRETAKEG